MRKKITWGSPFSWKGPQFHIKLGTLGSPKYYEIGDGGPRFHMKLGTRGPHFGGPHSHMTPVCIYYRRLEGVKFLIRAEVNTHPEVNLHSGILNMGEFNMADRTAGQLESTLRVSKRQCEGF